MFSQVIEGSQFAKHAYVLRNNIFNAMRCGAATKENLRDRCIRALYPNQDRALLHKLSNKKFLFGVFDGHGSDGDKVSSFACKEMPTLLDKTTLQKKDFENANQKIQAALEQKSYAQESGTTAVVAVLDDDRLTVANTGDSRLFVARNGKEFFSTEDHKSNNLNEKKRILKNGGHIVGPYVYATQGSYGLALSRSLGDVMCHDNDVVIAQPEINTITVQTEDFIIIASDGLFDVMTNDEVIRFVSRCLKKNMDIYTIASKLTERAHYRGSMDDITVIVLTIK